VCSSFLSLSCYDFIFFSLIPFPPPPFIPLLPTRQAAWDAVSDVFGDYLGTILRVSASGSIVAKNLANTGENFALGACFIVNVLLWLCAKLSTEFALP
jgi:hypothetical protein